MVAVKILAILAKSFKRLFLSATLTLVVSPNSWAQGFESNSNVTQSAAAVAAYWTPERMLAAKPPTMARLSSGSLVRVSRSNLPPGAYPGLRPGWDPRSDMPKPTQNSVKNFQPGTQEYALAMAAPALTFGSGPANPVDYGNYGPFQRWTWFGRYLTYPMAVVGKYFFTNGGLDYVCSGTVWNRNMFVTAGHCVSDGAGTWNTSGMFCPSYNAGGANPAVGCWNVSTLGTSTDWHTGSDFDRDYACGITSSTGTVIADNIGDHIGWAGTAWNWPATQQTFSLGYPQAAPFAGVHIVVTAATEWYQMNQGGDANVSKYIGSDQTGGTSGGPWWLNLAHRNSEYAAVDPSSTTDFGQTSAFSAPMVNGVNSHRNCLVNCTQSPPTAAAGQYWDEMGSPQFDTSVGVDFFDSCVGIGGG